MRPSVESFLGVVVMVSVVLVTGNLSTTEDHCPSGCDMDRCQCYPDGPRDGLVVICEGPMEESFTRCLNPDVVEFQLHGSRLMSLKRKDFENATRLDTIDISGNEVLTTVESGTFTELHDLRQIFLDHNAIAGIEVSIFPTSGSVESIRLNNNRIWPINYEVVFFNLGQLRELRLDSNLIEEFRCRSLNHLTALDLSGNRIKELVRETFEDCPELQYLNVSNNIIDAVAVDWTLLKEIRTLDIHKNFIIALGDSFSSATVNLTKLDLGFNEFSEVPVLPVSLVHLDLSGNRFKTLPNNSFVNLTKVKVMEISDGPCLTTIEELAFAGMTSMSTLTLERNRELSSLPLNPWPNSRELEKISLAWNEISVFGPELFSGLERLKRADISGNPVDCSCSNRWMRIEMDDPDKGWMNSWKNGSEAVVCHTPVNLEGFLVSQLNPNDLTCQPSTLFHHEQKEMPEEITFEAFLMNGVPNTSWHFPDGTRLVGQRYRINTSLPFHSLGDGPQADEMLLENLEIIARLVLPRTKDDDQLQYGEYMVQWQNAGGLGNFTFTLAHPPTPAPPHGSSGLRPSDVAVIVLCVLLFLIMIFGGILLNRYLTSRSPFVNLTASSSSSDDRDALHGSNEDQSDDEDEDEIRSITSNQLPSNYGSAIDEPNNPFQVD